MFLLEELIAKTCFEQLINNNEFAINLDEIVVLFDDKSFQEFDSWRNLIHELCVRSYSKIYFKKADNPTFTLEQLNTDSKDNLEQFLSEIDIGYEPQYFSYQLYNLDNFARKLFDITYDKGFIEYQNLS